MALFPPFSCLLATSCLVHSLVITVISLAGVSVFSFRQQKKKQTQKTKPPEPFCFLSLLLSGEAFSSFLFFFGDLGWIVWFR